MKCRSFTAIVLAVAMLVSFGLCNLSVAADPVAHTKFLEDAGTVYDDLTHTPLGTYYNWFAETDTAFTIAYYGDTYPPSQLQGTTVYDSYYLAKNSSGVVFEVTVTDDVVEFGGNGTNSELEGFDSHSNYSELTKNVAGIHFYARITNTVQSCVGNANYGSRTSTKMFYFNQIGFLFW